MPITIKELLPSDLMAQVVEKINFNFDQLLLAGGGPPGPQGPIGPAGVPGPIGPRGDHWFVGASAFNQQFDHDGISPLKVEDHFLDPLGDVYSYFDIAGVTGWTYSGINLMGPTGPPGATGGSNEWFLFEASLPTNSVPGGYQPSFYAPSTTQTTGTINIDYLIPSGANKNSIFLGDANWAFTELENYGNSPTLTPLTGDTSPVPKLAIIQNNTNIFGMNGLVIGSMGLTSGVQPNPVYGSTSNKTNARDFFYAGFANEITTGGDYQSKFLMRTLTMPMRIQVGGQRQGEAAYANKEFELYASDIRLDAYDTGQVTRNFIRVRKVPVWGNIGVYNGNAREVILNALSNITTVSNLAGNNIWGYVGLQNQTGSGNISILGLQHEFGTVIIGPTYSSSLDRVYGLPGRQGLAIVRRITAISGTNNILEYTPGQSVKDSAISFYQMDYAASNDTDTNSAIGGRIVPVRTFNDPAFWSDEVETGDTPNVIDSLIIGAGLKSPATSSTTATAGGRISIQNRINALSKPQMPFHVSLDTDNATRNIPWDGGPATPGIQHWAVGFDQWAGETRPGGIGIAYSPWQDGTGATGTFRRNPVIQTYYRRDRGTSQPIDGFGSRNGLSQGINNPHMYFQLGSQNFNGNIGIGFFPGNATFPAGNTAWLGDAAFAKVSIQGSVTIGSTANGYHKFLTSRFDNSILLEGALIQGATGLFSQINTVVHGYTATNNVLTGAIAISTRDLILGRSFISRGYPDAVILPEFSLPDLKTGMAQGAGNTGIGYLVANNILPQSGPTAYPNPDTAPFNNTAPTRIAKFSARGEAGYTGNIEYGSLTAEVTFSTRPKTIGVNDLVQKISTLSYPGVPAPVARSVWEIPTNSSLIFLDLSGYRSGVATSLWNGTQWSSGAGQFTLDGTVWTGNPPVPGISAAGKTNAIGFTLQNGHFDGQTLKLITLNALNLNTGALLAGVPPFNGTVAQSIILQPISDNIIMSAEPIWSSNAGNTIPFNGGLSVNNFGFPFSTVLRKDGINDAYPLPFGMGPSGPLAVPPIPGTLSLPLVNNRIDSTITEINREMARWTNNALSGVFSGLGYGCFYLFPYRSIEFVWRFDAPTGTSGKWFEIGRENLVAPQARSYNPLDLNDGDVIIVDPGDGGDDGGGGGPIDPNLCCFVPGTLISMADGTFKPIEDIEIGDKFLSIDIETRETVENEVKETATSNRFKLFNYTLDNGTTFTTTEDHPIWVVGKGWSSMDPAKSVKAYRESIEVAQIEVGDILIGDNSEYQIVSIVRSSIVDPITTYTFTAKDRRYQNYIAAGILVHNKTAPNGPGGAQEAVVCVDAFDPLTNP